MDNMPNKIAERLHEIGFPLDMFDPHDVTMHVANDTWCVVADGSSARLFSDMVGGDIDQKLDETTWLLATRRMAHDIVCCAMAVMVGTPARRCDCVVIGHATMFGDALQWPFHDMVVDHFENHPWALPICMN